MDRKTAKAMTADIEKALEKIGTKYGGTFSYKGGRFDDVSFKPRFEFSETSAAGGDAKAEQEWTRFKTYHGLPTLAGVELGAEFVVNGTKYKLVGCKPRSPKWPIVGEGPRGGRYKFQLASLERGLV